MQTEYIKDICTQNGHERCLICGTKNPWSLRLSFDFDGIHSYAAFKPHPGLQGYMGIVHGGIISAVLDSAMTNCLFYHNIKAVTGELKVKFIHPVPCSQTAGLRAWIQTSRSPLYIMKSELTLDKRIMAWAEAKFMKLS